MDEGVTLPQYRMQIKKIKIFANLRKKSATPNIINRFADIRKGHEGTGSCLSEMRSRVTDHM